MQQDSTDVVKNVSEPSILRSAAVMSLATLTSRVLGMIRDMVMAAMFSRMVSDAYVVAFRLPNLFRRILGEGSLAASFVPLYVETLNRDKAEAKAFANAVLSMLVVLTATLSVLGTVYMDVIMRHLVGGESYMQVEGKYELTVFFGRIMFCYLFLVTTYAFYMSVANAHKVFFWPALAPAGFNLVTIVSAFMPTWQMYGDQLAIGVTLGGVLQIAMTILPLKRLAVLPVWTFHWAVRGVKQFFRVVLPSMLGMSVAQLLGILNVNFASHLPQGSHSYIYLADRLLEFPQSLLSVSLGVALLPTLSELWVKGERTRFTQTAQRHIRLLMTLSLPAAVGLYALAEPIIRVVYARGQFVESDVLPTAHVLSIYALVLVVSGLHRVTVPCFYAIQNTWLPAVNSAFCLVAHYFIAGWATENYGLTGLVGATAFTGALNLFILLVSYKMIFGELGVFDFLRSVAWLTPSLIVMGFSARSLNLALVEWLGALSAQHIGAMSATFVHLLALMTSILVAVVLFFAVNRMVCHPEACEILKMFSSRLRSRRRA